MTGNIVTGDWGRDDGRFSNGGTGQQGGRGRVHHVYSYALRRPLSQPGRHLASQDDCTPLATIRCSSQGPGTVKSTKPWLFDGLLDAWLPQVLTGTAGSPPQAPSPNTDVASLALALINIQLHNSHIQHSIRQITMLLHFQLRVWKPSSPISPSLARL